MERDEYGKALVKRGRCSICGSRVSALADEDFECCQYEHEEEEISTEPDRRFISVENHTKINFSVKDVILAMIGYGFKDIKTLWVELSTIGYDNVMMLGEEVLSHLLDELEQDEYIEVYWDTERVRRLERE